MKRGLFLKYVTLFVGLVAVVSAINAALDLYFVYQDNRRASIDVQREKAAAAAQTIESFIKEIERQIGWVAYAQFDSLPAEQRRFDYVRLQRQVPAITELTQLDRTGHEQLRVSRLSMDVVGSNQDRSAEPAFTETRARKIYYGPVYFRKGSEPYLTMAVAHGGRGGVTVADVNLKLIWDVVSQIKIGQNGYAYVVDRQGRLVAHPDISLVLRGTDMSRLAQVEAVLKQQDDAAAADTAADARSRAGVSVLSAHATIPALDWIVFVELPTAEAQKPVIDTGLRDLALLLFGLLIAGAAAALLARRMVVPIRVLQEGAQRIGGGDLSHRLSIKTGDELEALADQFNQSTKALQESYETLEQRVEDRTAELRESLEQQTATAEILQVISRSPTNVQPVLDAVVAAACKFCGATDAAMILRDGEEIVGVAHDGDLSNWVGERRPLDRTSTTGRAIVDGRTIHTPDVEALDPREFGAAITLAREHKWRANIVAPMLREGQAIGCIVLRKPEPGAFTSRQIDVLEALASQAVIAIQNVRLFTQLSESLEQQTATAEILQVISQSPTDVQPVLDAIVSAARRFCGADDATIVLREGKELVLANHEGTLEQFTGRRLPLDKSTTAGCAVLEKRTFHIPDVDEVLPGQYPLTVDLSRQSNVRAVLSVPMVREGEAMGCILLRKPTAVPYAPRQIELAEAFAAQAVIAIQNVRLFTELSESLEQQTATAEILQVISQSPTDVEPVLEAVAKAAVRFCGADDAVIALRDGDGWYAASHEGPMTVLPPHQKQPLDRETSPGRAMVDGATVHLPDIEALDPVEFAATRRMGAQMGFRSALAAPMMREGSTIGAIALRRPATGAFSPRQIELLETFAAQAVIAIENVRLFTEIQEKSRQLEIASQHKSQFLANMSHELRTPLNAILGYTEMMVDGLYGDLPVKAQTTLERVQSNGKHLLGLINDVLDLSKIEAGQLSLAIEEYSVPDMVATVMSATESLAKTKGIALVSALPQSLPRGHGDARRLTQVLLNLVGNAIKFTDEGKVEIRARQQGDRFKISVVDTGPGIAKPDQAKIFEEFQQVDNTSTRKKGGTGLGLSISRKIVELHGGYISVESDLGRGSNFKITIPVTAAPAKEAAQ